MREILFRSKRTDNGEWIEGYLYRIAEELNPFIMLVNRYAESHKVEAKTVGQFTGLTDKNGNKVFEGDIFRYESSSQTVYGVVEYRTDYNEYCTHNPAGFAVKWVTGDLREDLPFWCRKHSKATIVGNIFDNPKLMEEE